MAETILWEEDVHPGATWSHVLKRGTALRITDISGGANVGAIFYNADNLTERYNMPDTLKAQHIARLTAGNVLYSDMGRVLLSITHDSLGWHDPLGGCSNAKLVQRKYGESSYQQSRNDFHKNAKESFTVELAKYGLGLRDLVSNINLFSKVIVQEDGTMALETEHSKAGSVVELRAEMNVLTILNTCQHPMDTSPHYEPRRVHLKLLRVPSPSADDPCRLSRPENERGFSLSERYFL